MLKKYDNKYVLVNILTCRIKHLTEGNILPYISVEELQHIKNKYLISEWTYYIALREYELGLLDEYKFEYV